MQESRSVTISVTLPSDLADELERLQTAEPEFLQNVLTYGLMRRAVFAHLLNVTGSSTRSKASTTNSSMQSSYEFS